MASKTAIDAAFEEIETEFGESRVVRKELIKNLRDVVANPEMKISPYDKSMMIQSKLMVIKTLDDLLKSNEDISVKKLKLQLSRSEGEQNGQVGATIVALLKSIRGNGDPANPGEGVDRNDAVAKLKEMQQGNAKLAVSEGETEPCGSTPTTDGDAPVATTQTTQKEEDEDEE